MASQDLSGSIGNLAIIGMSCRLPDARSVDAFWKNLCEGKESIRFFNDEELSASGVESSELSDPNYIKARAVLEGIEEFDASFFGFTPREAEIIDPQHRIFLENCWSVLEDAGYDCQKYKGRIGVFAGGSISSYLLNNICKDRKLSSSDNVFQILVGNDKDHLCPRVSYKMNLTGPSVNINTACSSSLVSICLACQSLLTYQCDMTIAGGVSILVPNKVGYLYQEGNILSSDGHCRAFDAKASGTVGGSGAGVVVIKRLEDALNDRDFIYAIIKGAAINNDGSSKVGYAAPNIDAQTEVILEAQALSGLDAETITYIEAHGTGTALGDPIEIEALTKAFSLSTNKRGFCAIGSVKTNIGHLDAASGVAGLIKTVLALHHKIVPPSLNYENPNPKIDFINSPFYVNNKLLEWKRQGSARRAAVSSFGIGGTNAHVILEEAPDIEPSGKSRPWHLLLLSAKTNSALDTATAKLTEYLRQHPEVNIADVAYTLQVGRRAFNHRRFVICKDVSDAISALESLNPARVFTSSLDNNNFTSSVTFMFPGLGVQYVNIGVELYREEQTFRKYVDLCFEKISSYLNVDLREILFMDQHVNKDTLPFKQTGITHLALFVVEYAMAKLWMEWGVSPQRMIGHSIGEYVAACLSEVLSLDDALMIISERDRLIRELPAGSMLSVPLGEKEIQPFLGKDLSLASVDGPSLCVLSGPTYAIEMLESQLAERDLKCQALYCSHAFHSRMMDPILEKFGEIVNRVKLAAPGIPYISNITGNWIKAEEAQDISYWIRHLRQAVRFSHGLEQLSKVDQSIFLEIGPGTSLCTLAQKHLNSMSDTVVLSSLPSYQEQPSGIKFMLTSLAKLWLRGVDINWTNFYVNEHRRRIPLPTYPFERQRYWIDSQKTCESKKSLAKKSDISDWFYVPIWRQSVLPPSSNDKDIDLKSPILMFIDDCGLGSGLLTRLQARGLEVIIVRRGDTFSKQKDGIYTINPQQHEHYSTLIKELFTIGKKRLGAIIHLWNITKESETISIDTAQELGFYSLLFIAQVLGEQLYLPAMIDGKQIDSLKMIIVSNNIQQVTGEELLYPGKATVLGPVKVIPQEYQNITCCSVDIVSSELIGIKKERLLKQLETEIISNTHDNVIAYRGGFRWIQTFEQLCQQDQFDCPSKKLREGGVYLITGGLGGMGLALAEYLAKTVHAKLILIGRSYLPSRDQRRQWLLSHGDDDVISRKIRKLEYIERLGAELIAESANVTDFGQMQRIFDIAKERFGQINGVIHAAGVAPGSIIQKKTVTEVEEIFAAKLKGTQVLDTIFRDKDLDFFILCSSLRSFLGGPGAVDYCAANIFLDYFARKKNSEDGTSITTVNWDGWLNVGMSAESTRLSKASSLNISQIGMLPEEGVDVFRRILHIPLSQIVISIHDVNSIIEYWDKYITSLFEKTLNNNDLTDSLYCRPKLSNPYVAPRDSIEKTIADVWQKVFGINKIGIHDNFFELGGDSVLAIQVMTELKKIGITVNPEYVFKCQTIAEVVTVLNSAPSLNCEQGLVAGLVPITPIQSWFFEQHLPEAYHFNQSMALNVPFDIEVKLLDKVVTELFSHHDILRSRFIYKDSVWQHKIVENEEVTPIVVVDLFEVESDTQQIIFESVVAELQASLNLSNGPLMRVVLFRFKADKPCCLVFMVHHLVIDGISWRTLLEDFENAYDSLVKDEDIKLPAKTTSFQYWSNCLSEYSKSEYLAGELDYWLSESQISSTLPLDFPDGVNTWLSSRTVTLSLSPEETDLLLHQANKAYNTQTNELLLTALTQSFCHWTGSRILLIDLEGHGRENLFEDIDISRTVGWFTSIYPVVLSLDAINDPGDSLRSVKEQLRSVPCGGIGYGLLRYLRGDEAVIEKMSKLPKAEISFLYLGQFSNALMKSQLLKPFKESFCFSCSPLNKRVYLLNVTGAVVEGRLKMNWEYSENIHKKSTIENIAQDFMDFLKAVIRHCQLPEAGSLTPSDFVLTKNLGQKQLDKIIDRFDQAKEL
jgi:non-ribosomal peptide synthase protein (TIGR01720 family)